jgi:hypothetical protein
LLAEIEGGSLARETPEGERRVLKVKMFEMFGREATEAAFRWVDDELSALPPEAQFAAWWIVQRDELESRLPANRTPGVIPIPVPDRFKADLSRFVLLEEMLYELTHGPADGVEAWTGDTLLGTLPPIDGGWGPPGNTQILAGDVLRWFRGWQDEMDNELAEMIADVQLLPNLEVASGVRLRINPEGLAELLFHKQLEARIRKLSEREKRVIGLRFALEDGHPRTLEEVGHELGLTPAEVEEIESTALSKLESERPNDT